jgi:UDP-N-acetylmuramoyl-tripeptide--D-alanyl-D-alanine ligase
VEALPSHGTAVLNADDPNVADMRAHTAASVVTFGASPIADVRIADLRLDALARPLFALATPWGTVDVQCGASGAHMASNAAAALAVAGALGVDLGTAAGALREARVSSSRMDLRRNASGAIVIDDAYNANPTSMRAALAALAAIDARRRIAVLGVMAELDDAASAHRDITALVRDLGIELVAVGTDLYGVEPTDRPAAVIGELGSGDAVLVKASRVAGLDRLAAELLGEERVGR